MSPPRSTGCCRRYVPSWKIAVAGRAGAPAMLAHRWHDGPCRGRLARPTWEADRIRPLLAMKLPEIDAGFGIDMIRLEAVATEPLSPQQHSGHMAASAAAAARMTGNRGLEDLIGRIGARIGLESITRRHPGDSHIPEKASLTLAAAWSEAAGDWPAPPVPRPLMLWPPEPVMAPDAPAVPDTFRWRRQAHRVTAAVGPERLAPEWWLDDPAWRSGVRDYWRVTTDGGTPAVALLRTWRSDVGGLVLSWRVRMKRTSPGSADWVGAIKPRRRV